MLDDVNDIDLKDRVTKVEQKVIREPENLLDFSKYLPSVGELDSK